MLSRYAVAAVALLTWAAWTLPAWLAAVGGSALFVGLLLAVGNLVLTIRRHAPQSLLGIAVGGEGTTPAAEKES
jgi:hypothetical protein